MDRGKQSDTAKRGCPQRPDNGCPPPQPPGHTHIPSPPRYNEVSFYALNIIHPVTHALGNSLKRVVMIAVSVAVLNHKFTPLGLAGCTMAIGGVMAYSITKARLETIGVVVPVGKVAEVAAAAAAAEAEAEAEAETAEGATAIEKEGQGEEQLEKEEEEDKGEGKGAGDAPVADKAA